jgi:hypothetical protein
MSKLIHAASIIALAAAASSASAWYNAPVVTPEMAEQHMKAVSARHEAMAEQHMKGVDQAMEAHRRMIEQDAARFAGMPSGAEHAFPEMPPMPAFGQYPTMPEMPATPELGQYPAMPEMPAMPELGQYPEMPELPSIPGMQTPDAPELMKTRLEQMDAQRAKLQQEMQERREAFKTSSEQRRAAHRQAMERTHLAGYAPRMHPATLSSKDCAPTAQAPEQQAAAPSTTAQ